MADHQSFFDDIIHYSRAVGKYQIHGTSIAVIDQNRLNINAKSQDTNDRVLSKGVLLLGTPGSGKSQTAFRFIQQNQASLISDDQTYLMQKDHRMFAGAIGKIQGRLEVRDIGIIEVPFITEHKIDLIIILDKIKSQNHIYHDKPDQIIWGETRCPSYLFHGSDQALLDKIRFLLFGLSRNIFFDP